MVVPQYPGSVPGYCTTRVGSHRLGPGAWVTLLSWGRIFDHVSRDLAQPDPEFSHCEYMVAFGQPQVGVFFLTMFPSTRVIPRHRALPHRSLILSSGRTALQSSRAVVSHFLTPSPRRVEREPCEHRREARLFWSGYRRVPGNTYDDCIMGIRSGRCRQQTVVCRPLPV